MWQTASHPPSQPRCRSIYHAMLCVVQVKSDKVTSWINFRLQHADWGVQGTGNRLIDSTRWQPAAITVSCQCQQQSLTDMITGCPWVTVHCAFSHICGCSQEGGAGMAQCGQKWTRGKGSIFSVFLQMSVMDDLKGHSLNSYLLQFHAKSSCSHTVVIEHYNLVPAKGQWCSVAG